MNSDVGFLLALTILPLLFWVLGRVLYAHWLVERHNQNATPLKEFSSHPSQQDYFFAKAHALGIQLTKSLFISTAEALSVVIMLSMKITKILITKGLNGLSKIRILLKRKLNRKALKN